MSTINYAPLNVSDPNEKQAGSKMNACIYQLTSRSAYNPKPDLLLLVNLVWKGTGIGTGTETVIILGNAFPLEVLFMKPQHTHTPKKKHKNEDLTVFRYIVRFGFESMPPVLLVE